MQTYLCQHHQELVFLIGLLTQVLGGDRTSTTQVTVATVRPVTSQIIYVTFLEEDHLLL